MLNMIWPRIMKVFWFFKYLTLLYLVSGGEYDSSTPGDICGPVERYQPWYQQYLVCDVVSQIFYFAFIKIPYAKSGYE